MTDIIKLLWDAVLIIVIFLSLLYAALYIFQEAMLFHPQPLTPATLDWTRKNFPNAEVKLSANDGTILHGWVYIPSGPGPYPLLLFFGGNADEMSSYLYMHKEFSGWAIGAINYRGYGLSQGQPTQQTLLADALDIYDELAQRSRIDSSRIVAFGRSLGTGIAVYLAAKRSLQGIILVSPYDSIRALAQKFNPYAPIGLLLKHPFDSLTLAPKINIPMLALVGAKDTLISPRHSKRLVNAWSGSTTLHIISGANHNTIIHDIKSGESIKIIKQFLRSIEN